EVVFAGATASLTIISGGTLGVYGSSLSAVINNGGHTYVWSGGLDSGAHVNSGGFETVTSGGTASAAVISGGTLEIMSGGGLGSPPPSSAAVTFAVSGGGILQLDDSQHFGGLVAGFGQPDLIDLRDIAFDSSTHLSWTQSGTSGTLTVSNSVASASILLLGQ